MWLLGVLLLTAVAAPLGGQERAEERSAPVYGIAQIRIEDREAYREYERGFGAIFRRYDGEFLAASESPDIVEGEWPWTRTVLLRFPSKKALERWYQSKEYQELAKHRWASSTTNIILLEARPESTPSRPATRSP